VSKAFIPLPAGAKAVYTSGPTLSYFRHPDWLGSSRFASTPNRTMYYSGAYAPFGEAYSEAGTADRSFTGQNQDTVSGSTAGLYDFLFREYAQYGRWISPDPAGMAAVNLADPRSINRYAYVLNNPLIMVDPLGLCGEADTWDPSTNTVGGFMPCPGGSGGGFFFGSNSSNRMFYWDPIYGQQIHPGRKPVFSQNPPPPKQQPKCPSPLRSTINSIALQALLPQAYDLGETAATLTGHVVQVGIGGSGAYGLPVIQAGTAGQSSFSLVFDPMGQVGLAISFGLGPGLGTGFVAGGQLSYSWKASSIFDVSGFSGGGGLAYGNGYGGSVDVSSNAGGTVTVTAGVGEGAFGLAFVPSYTVLIPLVCQ